MRVLVFERDIINGYGDMQWVLIKEGELVECTKSMFRIKSSYRTWILNRVKYTYNWYNKSWYKYEEIGNCHD